jgi:rhodanese-related sulfurtransferase
MKRILPLFLAFGLTFAANAQYKNDNVLYQAIDVAELCKTLSQNPEYLLLDVRSKGENEDTSFSVSLNIGRLKGARNIMVQELGQRIHELDEYRDKPVFVYCSHSQRSRRASKMLADSGFTKVFNINGGMTALHASEQDCIQQLMESQKAYSVLPAAELCDLVKNKRNEIFLLDVRSDSAWNRVSRFEKENGIGHLKGATHIARRDMATNLGQIPRDKHIIISDIGGAEPAFAALLLTKLGYTNVSVLLEGMDRFLLTDEKELPCKAELYQTSAPYSLMNAFEFGRFIKEAKNYLLLDVRTADEFANKHKDEFRNIGHLSQAINVPWTDLSQKLADLSAHKNKQVVVYGFSGGPEAFVAAKQLTDAGFKNVNVLMGGIFSVRWTAANRKDQAYLAELVVEVPEVNR